MVKPMSQLTWMCVTVVLIAVGSIAWLLTTGTGCEIYLVGKIDVPLKGTIVSLRADRELGRIAGVVVNKGVVIGSGDSAHEVEIRYGEFHDAVLVDQQSAVAVGARGITKVSLTRQAVTEPVFVPGYANGIGMLPQGGVLVTSYSMSDLTAPGGIFLYDLKSDLGGVVSLEDECGCDPVSVNGEFAATACSDGNLKVYRIRPDHGVFACEVVINSPVRLAVPARCCISSRGKHLLVKDFDGLHSFRIANDTVHLQYTLPYPLQHGAAMQAVAMTPDERLGVAMRDKGFVVFDIETGRELCGSSKLTSAVTFETGTDESRPGEYVLYTAHRDGISQWRVAAEVR